MAKSALQRELHKKRPFELPEEEAYLNLARTNSLLQGEFARLFKTYGISSPLYNLLRILRGAGQAGLPCQEIAEHMVTRVPDITRLIDRLEEARLARRERSREDRRVVCITITPAGVKLLERLDDPVRQLHRRLLGHLGKAELKELNALLVKARAALPASS